MRTMAFRDQDERAAPAVFQARQHPGCADPAGHVHVVAAGVHDADLVAFLVAGAHLAGIVDAGLCDLGNLFAMR